MLNTKRRYFEEGVCSTFLNNILVSHQNNKKGNKSSYDTDSILYLVQIRFLLINVLNFDLFLTQNYHMVSEDKKYGVQIIWITFIVIYKIYIKLYLRMKSYKIFNVNENFIAFHS